MVGRGEWQDSSHTLELRCFVQDLTFGHKARKPATPNRRGDGQRVSLRLSGRVQIG